MENSTVASVSEVAGYGTSPVTYNREHWILIGTLLSPILWTLVILITNPLFGIGFFGYGRGYSDSITPILHQGSRTLLYLAGFSAFILFFQRGTFTQFPTNYEHFKLWLRNSPGSRRFFAVIGVFLALTMVKWLSTEIPTQAYALSNWFSMRTVFQWGQSTLNAVRLFWPFVALILIRSHAAKWSYKERESRNVRSVESLKDSLTVANELPSSSKKYWESRMLWMGIGWLAVTALNLLCNTLLTLLFKFLQRSGEMTSRFFNVHFLPFTVGLAALPLVLMALFLLHHRFRLFRAWLKHKVVPLCWLCTGLVLIFAVWNWITSLVEMPAQNWAAKSQAAWYFVFSGSQSLWTLAVALLLTFAVSRRVRCHGQIW